MVNYLAAVIDDFTSRKEADRSRNFFRWSSNLLPFPSRIPQMTICMDLVLEVTIVQQDTEGKKLQIYLAIYVISQKLYQLKV